MAHAKLISESGLYKLIIRSDKPQTRAFQDCVTKIVHPAIRKDANCPLRWA
ncbi:BRO family protein [Halomonas sp.]|uniref:BRO family protein n=1 Tax=Halomonas sp. TaxID=1486246 RepID=UPI003A10012E